MAQGVEGFHLASEFIRPDGVDWGFFDGKKQVTARLPFSEITEIVASRNDVPSALMDLILTFEEAHKGEEVFILHVSTGNQLQPLMLHPQVSRSVIINGLVDSRSLKVQRVSSIDELLVVFDTLQRRTENGLKVLLLLDRLDDLFALWRREEKKESLTKHSIAQKRKEYVARESLFRTPGRKHDFWPESDPFYTENSQIPQCMDKLTYLLSTKEVIACWIRSKSETEPHKQGHNLLKDERNGPTEGWKEGEVLWSSSLRHGPVAKVGGKLPPFGEAWKQRVPTVLTYATPPPEKEGNG